MAPQPALRAIAVSLLLAGMAAGVHAQLWDGPMRDSPARFFNDEDMRLFLDAARKVLNAPPEQGTTAWDNAATGSRGELTVVSAFTWQEHPCRQLRILTVARGQQATSTVHLCRVDERWRAVAPSQLQNRAP